MKPPETLEQATILVVGVGNELRGDDAAGLLVVRKLQNLNLPGVRMIESSGDGAELMDAWTGFHSVFVLDATIQAGHAGAVHRFEGHRQSLPADLFGISTHSFGLAEAIGLGRSLGRMPSELIVYGIEGHGFDIGQAVSPAVIASIQTVSEVVTAEIKEHLSTGV
jgi:hydrogenase maturation protease